MYDALHSTFQGGKLCYKVALNGKVALVNAQNKVIKPWLKGKYLAPVIVETPDEEEVISDNDFEMTITEPPPPIVTNSSERIPFKKNGKWGFEKYGEVMIPHKYEKVEFFDYRSKLAKVKYKGKWGYINMQGVEYFEE